MFIRGLLLKAALPITRVMNYMHISPSTRRVSARDYRDLIEKIKPGDILLSFRRLELSNIFIPGGWSHAALYVGNERVREAVSAGVRDEDLIDFMLSKDKIIVLRPLFSQQIIDKAIELSSVALGRSYDFLFDPSDKAFYCSELVYWSFKGAFMELLNQHFPMSIGEVLGVDTVVPDDFIKAQELVEAIGPAYPLKR